MRLYYLFILFAFSFSLNSCQKDSDQTVKQINKVSDIDSAFELFQQHTAPKTGYAYAVKVKKFVQMNSDTNKSNKYIEIFWKQGNSTNDNYFKNLGEQCKVMQQFVVGNVLESRYWARKMLVSAQSHSEIDVLDIYHLVGITYYTPPSQIDSTLKYWKLGFKQAVENNDGYRIYFFANNLGAMFYELGMFSISRQFFLKALNQAKLDNTVSPVLLNNIVNTLINSKDYRSAKEFFEENKTHFENLDFNKLENQSVYLNRVFLKQRFGETSSASQLLRDVDFDSMHATLKSKYLSLCLGQYALTKDTFFIRQSLRFDIEKAGIYAIETSMSLLADCKEDKALDFLWEILINDVDRKINSEDDYADSRQRRKLLSTLSFLLQKDKLLDANKRNQYSNIYVKLAENLNENDANWHNYINEINQLEDLFDGILRRNHEIATQKSNVKILALIILCVALGTIGLVFNHRLKIRTRLKKEALLEKEKDLLIRENTMNQRMVEFSKELIKFNKKVKEDIDKLILSGDNTDFLRKFRSDVIGFISVNLEQNPKVLDHNLESEDKPKEVDTSLWNELNQTEKRVFSMVKEGFKSNEIARMLGVSTQYVYNVKARIKRRGIPIK